MGESVDRYEALVRAGLALSSELSLPVVLQRIVEAALELTGAGYGALGVLGADGTLVDFVTSGIDPAQRAAIGALPTGRGILGVLIGGDRPLRLRDMSRDPRSAGFPPNHPPMRSFLGTPITARGQVFGNIYLTEKRGGGEFLAEDEAALVVLASQAGAAIANARLYEEASRRGRWLEAIRDITSAILSGTPVSELLSLVARKACGLVDGDRATIATPSLKDPSALVLRAAEGDSAERLRGMVVPIGQSLSGAALRAGEALVVTDAASDPRAYRPRVQAIDTGPMIIVPLVARGSAFGVLDVGRIHGKPAFTDTDLDLVRTFAEQAALCLEYARVQREVQRLAVLEDRERIGRDLHDGAIQSLFAVGMSLQATASLVGDARLARRMELAVKEIDGVIRDLRNYIFGLRPDVVAEHGIDEALRRLVTELEERTGIVAIADVDAHVARSLAPRAPDVLQMVREALSNIGRHSRATTCRVSLTRAADSAVLEIDDDGAGFDPLSPPPGGQGLRNLRERASAIGADLAIASAPGRGATVRVTIPLPASAG